MIHFLFLEISAIQSLNHWNILNLDILQGLLIVKQIMQLC